MKRKEIVEKLKSLNIAFDEKETTSNLRALLVSKSPKNVLKVFNYAGGKGKIQVAFNAADESPVELMIYEEIGKDPWDGSGIAAVDIKKAIDEISPKGRQLNCRINSRGGDVFEGLAIRSLLEDYEGKIVSIIDGVAASTASWMIPADEVHAHKSSQLFVHDAFGMCVGNAEDMQKASGDLDKTSQQIAGFYAEKTGDDEETMRDLMRAETLMTGEEALEYGLVDKIIGGEAASNFTTEQINSMKQRLAQLKNLAVANRDTQTTHPAASTAINSAAQTAVLINAPVTATATDSAASKAAGKQNRTTQTTTIIMNKEKMIALLNKWGVSIPANATDEQLTALVEAGKPEAKPATDGIAELTAKVNTLAAQNSAIAQKAIANRIDELIRNDKLTAAEREDAIALASDATTGEKYLNSLEKRPSMVVGAAPLRNSVEIAGDSAMDVQKLVLGDHAFRNQFFGAGANKLESYSPEQKKKIYNEISVSAKKVCTAIKASKNKIIAMWNASAIDTGLQRQVILQEMLEEFAVTLLPFQNFSTVFSNVPREGTDTVDVPFYPLATDASNSWNPATGYSGTGGAVNAKPIYIGGSGTTSGVNAPAGYAKDRKWLALSFSSYELASQPWVNWQKLAQQKANKLGVDIFTDVISRVITNANFGASVKAVPPAAFSGDDVADLCETATGLNWPALNRSLVLNHTYRTPLLKDPTFKQYLSYGSTDPLRKAIIKEAYGFENIDIVPNLTAYSPAGENLVGWINWMYAVLIATAPIMPTEDVRALLTRYDLATDEKTGLTLEYRRFGNLTLDQTTEVIECSYGAAPGVLTALKRITSA